MGIFLGPLFALLGAVAVFSFIILTGEKMYRDRNIVVSTWKQFKRIFIILFAIAVLVYQVHELYVYCIHGGRF